MKDRFRGKCALITGGATGLGAAVGQHIASEGGAVAILDINEKAGRETASRIGGRFWHCDVSDPTNWRNVVSEVTSSLGTIGFAHLNAGIMTQRPDQTLDAARLENVSPKRYREVVSTNVDGVVFGFQTLLPRMIAEGGHCITVTSSAAGLVPIPFDPIYALTKHALVGLVRSLALAYAAASVRINALCPHGIDTDLVPAELRGDARALMTPAEMGREIIDLLLHGQTGEVRLKLNRDTPAQVSAPPNIGLPPKGEPVARLVHRGR